ncbi:uncharacterized protein TNCV_4125651 [Trichonephila clavipes]|nr:uncharacterized protein TNCV_4125651 [Trichonephila clavipes]
MDQRQKCKSLGMSTGKERKDKLNEIRRRVENREGSLGYPRFVRPVFTKDSKPLGKSKKKITRVPRDCDTRTHLKKVGSRCSRLGGIMLGGILQTFTSSTQFTQKGPVIVANSSSILFFLETLWVIANSFSWTTMQSHRTVAADTALSIIEDIERKIGRCQVIYSQFGLAIHPNDHQARRRFVEWAQNEIAVVPDFHKRILFSDEAHFWLNGYVNKQNCRIWSEANPQVYVETPLHQEKLTVWCAFWAGGILLQKR